MIVSLVINGGSKVTVASAIAKFAKIDSLPSAEVEMSAGDWYIKRHAHKRRFEMRRHIVRAFKVVRVVGAFGY